METMDVSIFFTSEIWRTREAKCVRKLFYSPKM